MNLFKSVIKDMKSFLNSCHQKKVLLDISHPLIDEKSFIITYSKNRERLNDISNYATYFLKLIENKQYLCLLNDGSILQGYYKFSSDGNTLIEGCLIYLPNPGLTVSSEFKKMKEFEEKTSEYLSEYTARYIRIDFDVDPTQYKELIHPYCHIHIGYESDYRISIDKFPFFSEFIKFIMFLNNQDEWMEIIPNKINKSNSSISVDIETFMKERVKNSKDKFISSNMSASEKEHYKIVI